MFGSTQPAAGGLFGSQPAASTAGQNIINLAAVKPAEYVLASTIVFFDGG